MSAALGGAVELLDRSLAYTRVALADVRPALLPRPTPCPVWRLGDLLVHLADGLDAFTDAADGRVGLTGSEPRLDPLAPEVVDAVRDRASALLGPWATGSPGRSVRVGGAGLPGPVLVATAALELALHGWDVAQATGSRTPLPEPLAVHLLGVARAVIDPAERGVRFAAARPVAPTASHADRLLAWTGRGRPEMTGPGGPVHREPRTGRGSPS